MKSATIHSVCECQARLGAELDERRQVITGWAVDRGQRVKHHAPAHGIGHGARFQVGWACPCCGRNTLRSFDVGALAWSEAAPAPPPV